MIARKIKSLFAPKPAHAVPPGQRVYAIGDIHGRLDLLDQLLLRIEEDTAARGGEAQTRLVFLGDYVDRGPDSAGVVERLLELRAGPIPTRFLAGNHEEVFLKAIGGDDKLVRYFIRIGGRPTILSYGFSEEEYARLSFGEVGAELLHRVPRRHVDFLSTLEDLIEVGDYVFVHAGLRPGVAFGEQKIGDLRWIREDFLHSGANHGKMVVHGHTITDDVDLRPNRIGIDTGAYSSGRLTAVGLEGEARWFLST